MKKTFILLSLFMLALSASASAQKRMSPKQLFMLLPDNYVVGNAQERSKTLSLQASVEKSGKTDSFTFFMSGSSVPKMLAGDFKNPEGLCFLRVFRGKSSIFVGLRYQIGEAKEESPTTDKVKVSTFLLEYKGREWKDVSKAMIPEVPSDHAFKVLTENFQMKGLNREDVWVEYQFSEPKRGIIAAARIKGSDSITTLKFFKWNGKSFVESNYD